MKRLLLAILPALILVFLLPAFVYGQAQPEKSTLKGKVIDQKTRKPVEFAGVALLRATDSVQVSGTLTGAEGEFSLQAPKGNYLLRVSSVGYKTVKRALVYGGTLTDAGVVELEPGIALDTVKLEGEVIAVKVVNDTTEYNTKAYKVAPDANVEDGLKKMEGFEIDAKGNIKANGVDIKRVTVDGKEFFGNDPKIATKNLPYDAVAKIRVIDDKTEESKQTGVTDGKKEKVLDIVLKADRKKGWFGSASVAGGTEDRYLGSASINRFDNDKQFNVLLLGNNVNQVGFSSDEASNFGGGGGTSYSMSDMRGVTSMSINGVNVGSAQQGLTTTSSAGINFSDAWGKKNATRFSANYIGSTGKTLLLTDQSTQLSQLNETYFNTSNTTSDSKNQSHRLNVRLNGRIDSLTTFTLTPAFTLNVSDASRTGISAQNMASGSPVNSGSSQTRTKTTRPGVNGNVSILRTLKNKKGSVSFYVSGNYNPYDNDYFNHSENNFYSAKPSILINRLESQDQVSSYMNSNMNLNRTVHRMNTDGKSGYGLSWSLSPSININTNESDRNTLEFDPATGLYSRRLDSLTNNTRSITTRIGSTARINFNRAKWSVNLSGNAINVHLKGSIGDAKTFNEIQRDYLSVTPTLSFDYRPKQGRSISSYTSFYASPPSVNSLMLKQNNTSPLYIRQGNPDLKLSTSMNTSISYNASNLKKNTSTYLYVSFNKTFNSESQYSYFDKSTGITTSKPVNVQGNYSIYSNGSFTIPTGVKGLRLSPGLNLSTNHNVNFINSVANNSNQYTGGGTLGLNYAYKESFILYVNGRANYTHTRNSASATLNPSYLTLYNNVNLTVVPIKNWRLVADLLQSSTGKGQNFVLLNAGIQRSLMSANRLTLELRGFDLLNKNTDITRYAYDTQIVNTRNNNLGQYFYMKLLYKINKVGGKSNSSNVPPPPSILRF